MVKPRVSWVLTAAVIVVLVVSSVILIPLAIVFLALNWLIEKVTGWEKRHAQWCREQARRMTDERPALSDDDYLAAVNATHSDAAVWLATRESFAEHAGLPATAVHPDDTVGLLLTLMGLFGGLLDVQLDLERRFGVSFDRRVIEDRLVAAGHVDPRAFWSLDDVPFKALGAELVRAVCEGSHRHPP